MNLMEAAQLYLEHYPRRYEIFTARGEAESGHSKFVNACGVLKTEIDYIKELIDKGEQSMRDPREDGTGANIAMYIDALRQWHHPDTQQMLKMSEYGGQEFNLANDDEHVHTRPGFDVQVEVNHLRERGYKQPPNFTQKDAWQEVRDVYAELIGFIDEPSTNGRKATPTRGDSPASELS